MPKCGSRTLLNAFKALHNNVTVVSLEPYKGRVIPKHLWVSCFHVSELMQWVYLRFPVPKRMPMCAMSSNRWELAIMIGAGEGSVFGITARSLITRCLPMYVHVSNSDGVLKGK